MSSKKINMPVQPPGETQFKINIVTVLKAIRNFRRWLKKRRKKDVRELV
jgi:hypothetical protein